MPGSNNRWSRFDYTDRYKKLIYCTFDDTISRMHVSSLPELRIWRFRRTLYIGDTLLQNLLQCSWILKLLSDFPNDRFSKFPLLPLFYLTFVPYPRVENLLRLMCQSSPLFELKCFSFKVGSFLVQVSIFSIAIRCRMTDLGNFKKLLCHINDTS